MWQIVCAARVCWVVDNGDFVVRVCDCCRVDADLADAAASVAAFAARPSFRFSTPELVGAIRDLHALTSAATGVLARLVHEAVVLSVPKQDDATSTVTWLRGLLRISP